MPRASGNPRYFERLAQVPDDYQGPYLGKDMCLPASSWTNTVANSVSYARTSLLNALKIYIRSEKAATV